MMRGEPGRSSTSPSCDLDDLGQIATCAAPLLRRAYPKKPRVGPTRIGPIGVFGLSPPLRAIGVGGVHVDRNAVIAPQALGEAEMVAVAVREHDALDVVERAAHRRQLGAEIAPVTGQTGIDHGDPFGVDDEVRGDDVVADAVKVRSESHVDLRCRGCCAGYDT